MSLVDLPLSQDDRDLPEEAQAFLRESDGRIDRFLERRADDPVPGFVPSDYARVYQVLRHLSERGLATGPAFCEWGSGFGVVAGLASMLDFAAYGIEIEPELVAAARTLSRDFDLSVRFVCGSFVPRGGETLVERVEEFAWLATGGRDAHEELELDPDDFDVIFVYPWPGEEDAVTALFDRYAAGGALLLSFHGDTGFRLRRKG